MEIKYDHGYGRAIQASEIDSLDYYSKIYLQDQVVIKKEYFLKKVLNRQLFFVNAQESREVLAQKYGCLGIMTTIGERKVIASYTQEKLYHYDAHGVLNSIAYQIYDQAGHLIVSSFSQDLQQEIPDWDATKKYYYDQSIRPQQELFECHFDDAGVLIPIEIDVEELGLGDHDGTWIYNNEEGIQDLMQIFGMPRDLAEFYTSSTLFPWEK